MWLTKSVVGDKCVVTVQYMVSIHLFIVVPIRHIRAVAPYPTQARLYRNARIIKLFTLFAHVVIHAIQNQNQHENNEPMLLYMSTESFHKPNCDQ